MLTPPWRERLMRARLWIAERREWDVDPRVMLATIDAECGFDVRGRLHEIRTPVLVIAGDRDRAFQRISYAKRPTEFQEPGS